MVNYIKYLAIQLAKYTAKTVAVSKCFKVCTLHVCKAVHKVCETGSVRFGNYLLTTTRDFQN